MVTSSLPHEVAQALQKLQQELPPTASSHDEVWRIAARLLPHWQPRDFFFQAEGEPIALLYVTHPSYPQHVLLVRLFRQAVRATALAQEEESLTKLYNKLLEADTVIGARTRH